MSLFLPSDEFLKARQDRQLRAWLSRPLPPAPDGFPLGWDAAREMTEGLPVMFGRHTAADLVRAYSCGSLTTNEFIARFDEPPSETPETPSPDAFQTPAARGLLSGSDEPGGYLVDEDPILSPYSPPDWDCAAEGHIYTDSDRCTQCAPGGFENVEAITREVERETEAMQAQIEAMRKALRMDADARWSRKRQEWVKRPQFGDSRHY